VDSIRSARPDWSQLRIQIKSVPEGGGREEFLGVCQTPKREHTKKSKPDRAVWDVGMRLTASSLKSDNVENLN